MNTAFIEALHDIAREKGIAKEVLLEAIEAALISSYKRNFNSAQNVRVEINRETGVIRVWALKNVVEVVEDERIEISLSGARTVDATLELADTVEVEVTPRDFGRIAAQTAKQVVTQRIREAERGIIYEAFADREEKIVTGMIHRIDARNYYVDIGKAEALLPMSEVLPTDHFKMHDRLKAYILKVDQATKGPLLTISRIHPSLVRRLFELEIPEINEGVVKIHSVAREPGYRSKIAVYTNNADVDPIGACIGPKGTRIQPIIHELRGEKIDIVRWSPSPSQWIANALSPSKVVEVMISETEKIARVIVPDQQLSLAIGVKGQNARLAAKLTGWKIDIKSEAQAWEEEGRERTDTHMPQQSISIDREHENRS